MSKRIFQRQAEFCGKKLLAILPDTGKINTSKPQEEGGRMGDNIIFSAKKALETAFSVFLMGFGIARMLHSNIGSDPVTVFMDGTAKIMGVSSGAGVAVNNGLMILFTLLFNCKMFGAVSLGASIGLYLNLDFGCTSTDGGVLWISRALSLQYKHSLRIFYGISRILGIIMGGPACRVPGGAETAQSIGAILKAKGKNHRRSVCPSGGL